MKHTLAHHLRRNLNSLAAIVGRSAQKNQQFRRENRTYILSWMYLLYGLAPLVFGVIGLHSATKPLPTRYAAPAFAMVHQLDHNFPSQSIVVQGFDPGRAVGFHILDQRAEMMLDDLPPLDH